MLYFLDQLRSKASVVSTERGKGGGGGGWGLQERA